MKKILLLVAAITLTLSQLSGQEPTFEKGDKVLNLGIGFGTTLYSGTHYKSSCKYPQNSYKLKLGKKSNFKLVYEKDEIYREPDNRSFEGA